MGSAWPAAWLIVTFGAVVSIVTIVFAELPLTLPATSVARTRRVRAPAARVPLVTVYDPPVAITATPVLVFPLRRRMDASGSAVPVKVSTVSFVMRSDDETPVSLAIVKVDAGGAAGATVSITTTFVPDATLTLPATSVDVAVIANVPFASAVDVIEYVVAVVVRVPTIVALE